MRRIAPTKDLSPGDVPMLAGPTGAAADDQNPNTIDTAQPIANAIIIASKYTPMSASPRKRAGEIRHYPILPGA